MEWLGAVLSAVVGITGSIIGAFQRKKEREQAADSIDSTNQENLALQQEQWQREDNAYQRAVDDAKKAGLSAFSVAGSGGASSSTTYVARDKSDIPSANTEGAFRDMVQSLQTGTQIASTKAEIDKLKSEKEHTDEMTEYNREMHFLDLESRGIDLTFHRIFYELDKQKREVENKRLEIESNNLLSGEERKKKLHELDVINKALDNKRKSLDLLEDEATIYNPAFKGQRVSNYRTQLATENSNMVYQTEYNRKMNEYQSLLNQKYRGTVGYEIEKQKFETMKLIREYERLPSKYKEETWNNVLDCIEKGAQGFYFVSEGIRKWFPLQVANDMVSTIGFRGIND